MSDLATKSSGWAGETNRPLVCTSVCLSVNLLHHTLRKQKEQDKVERLARGSVRSAYSSACMEDTHCTARVLEASHLKKGRANLTQPTARTVTSARPPVPMGKHNAI